MRIIGIDPGYERVGIAVIESKPERLIYSDCVRTSPRSPVSERLRVIGNAVAKCIRDTKPAELAIETLLFNTNQKTALLVAAARGTIMYVAAEHGLPVAEYSPLQVKVALTSYGRADKQQVAYMISKIIALPKKKRLDDEYDAIALALTHSATSRVSVPES